MLCWIRYWCCLSNKGFSRNITNLTPPKVPGCKVISYACSVSFRSWCWEIVCTFVIVLSCSSASPWQGQLFASLSQEAQVQSHSGPHGLLGGQSGMGTGFVLSTSPLASFHQHSIHIHSPMLVVVVTGWKILSTLDSEVPLHEVLCYINNETAVFIFIEILCHV